MLALLNPFWVKNSHICRGGWTKHSPHCSSPSRSPYQVLKDLQLQDSWGMQGLNSAKDGSAAFSRLFSQVISSQGITSPGYSLWSQPDTGLQHDTVSNSLTLELPLSGYYGCRGRIPSHHLPRNVRPYLVECWHLVVHPWVTVFVDGVEGQPTQCGTGQDGPESHQVDVEGPANTHGSTKLELNIPQKTLPGPSKEVPMPAMRRSPGLWLPAGKGVTMTPSISPGVRSHF